MTRLTEKDLDEAIRCQREDWDEAELRDTPQWQPYTRGCAGACNQGRLPCNCGGQPMQWADIPSPWRWRIVAAVSAILVASIAMAFAGWPA